MKKQTNDAEILFPNAEITVKGETITVKEFSFIQGMKINAMARPMINDLGHFFSDEDADFSSMSVVFDNHAELLIHLMSVSTEKPIEWFETLSDSEGQSLLMTFWSVNKSFFINRLLLKSMETQQQAKASQASSAD